MAFDDQAGGTSRVYVAALDSRQPLPSVEGGSSFPLWSFDDESVFFIATRNGEQALFAQLADGTGAPELIVSPARAPEAWTPNGRLLNFITPRDGDYAISAWDAFDRTVTRVLGRDGSLQHSSHYSPDGRLLMLFSGRLRPFADRTDNRVVSADELRARLERATACRCRHARCSRFPWRCVSFAAFGSSSSRDASRSPSNTDIQRSVRRIRRRVARALGSERRHRVRLDPAQRRRHAGGASDRHRGIGAGPALQAW